MTEKPDYRTNVEDGPASIMSAKVCETLIKMIRRRDFLYTETGVTFTPPVLILLPLH